VFNKNIACKIVKFSDFKNAGGCITERLVVSTKTKDASGNWGIFMKNALKMCKEAAPCPAVVHGLPKALCSRL
jgi:hypothetical protein